jgi:hypothetical protein
VGAGDKPWTGKCTRVWLAGTFLPAGCLGNSSGLRRAVLTQRQAAGSQYGQINESSALLHSYS